MICSSSNIIRSNQAFYGWHQVLLSWEQDQTARTFQIYVQRSSEHENILPSSIGANYVKQDRKRDLDKCVALAIINLQYGSHVPTSITVVRCTKNGNHLLFLFQQNNGHLNFTPIIPKQTIQKRLFHEKVNYMSPVKSIHNQLMSSSN